jgi:hypothetical protein
MPENNRLPLGARGNAQLIQHTQMVHQGPIPSPEAFEAYERVLPGAADRILRMAETQATHGQGLERFAVRGDFFKAMMGTVLGYIAFAGAMGGAVFLLLNDKPIESLATFIVALGSAFGPKIYADFIQPKPPQPPATTP